MSKAAAVSRNRGRRKEILIFLSACLVAFIVGAVACSDASTRTVAPKPNPASVRVPAGNGENPFAFVGSGHNEGVDFVLRQVQAKKPKKATREALCRLAVQATTEFVVKAGRGGGVRSDVDLCSPGATLFPRSFLGMNPRLSIADGLDMTPRAADLANQVDYYASIASSAGELQGYLNPVNSAASNELAWDEGQVILSASAVAVSSFQYWVGNYNYWASVYSETSSNAYSKLPGTATPRLTFWDDLKHVTRADLRGAVQGGVAAKIAQRAIPEAALWMGIAASAIDIIEIALT